MSLSMAPFAECTPAPTTRALSCSRGVYKAQPLNATGNASSGFHLRQKPSPKISPRLKNGMKGKGRHARMARKYRSIQNTTINGFHARLAVDPMARAGGNPIDRKSTRLNSSHLVISYAVFCLKKNKLSE